MLIKLFKIAVGVLIIACVGLLIPNDGLAMFLEGVIGLAAVVIIITTIGILVKKKDELRNSKSLKIMVWFVSLVFIFVASTFIYAFTR
ncbi:MAG: hypothetical protein K0S38_298 [Candidatus Paceibacter sp.]|jgi:hypothetical protein|nr:hypothetical protein [Candidatus Paceibacter sp.]